ncbi:MAG: outer membrane beta-barrel protein [Halioglobus sp.]
MSPYSNHLCPGEVTVTQEEDDDDGTLYIPRGSDGSWTLREKSSGAVLGELNVTGGVLAVSTVTASTLSGSGASQSSFSRNVKGFIDVGWSMLYLSDIKENTRSGADMARADGFTVRDSADDDAQGWRVGVGIAIGDGKPWNSKGSHQWLARLGYSSWENMKGQFTATVPGLTIDSSGKQESEAWQTSVGFQYFVADNVGFSADLGYDWYDLKDSGGIVRQQDGMMLSFNDSTDSSTATFGLGLAYYFCENAGVRGSYRWSFDDVGSSQSNKPSTLAVDLFLTY